MTTLGPLFVVCRPCVVAVRSLVYLKIISTVEKKKRKEILPEASQAPFLLVLWWLYMFIIVIPVHVV